MPLLRDANPQNRPRARDLDTATHGQVYMAQGGDAGAWVSFGGDASGAPNSLQVTGLTIAGQAHGDTLYRGAGAWLRLPAGTAGQVLETRGPGQAPRWQDYGSFAATRVFRPEDYDSSGGADYSEAFEAMIGAMSPGDIVQLGGAVYRFSRTLVITKQITISGWWNAHYAVPRSQLYFPPNVLGVKLLVAGTLMNLYVYSSSPQRSTAPDGTADGVWARGSPKLINVRVEGFQGNGVSIDTKTLERSLSGGSRTNNVVTLVVDTALKPNAGNKRLSPGMVVNVFGFTAIDDDAELEVTGEDAGGAVLYLTRAGADADPLPMISVAANVQLTPDGASAIAMLAVPADVALAPGVRVSTSGLAPNYTDVYITQVTRAQGTDSVTSFRWLTGGLASTGACTVTVNRPIVRSIERANHWECHSVRCIGNRRHGFHTRGPDSNVGVAINLDCKSNGWTGIHEESSLGNYYFGPHTSDNGGDGIAASNASVGAGGIAEVSVGVGHGFNEDDPVFSEGLQYNTTRDGAHVIATTPTTVSFAVVTVVEGPAPSGAMNPSAGTLRKGRAINKPKSANTNQSYFFGTYAEKGQLKPNITYPAFALPADGGAVGSGLAPGFDVSYFQPATFTNYNYGSPSPNKLSFEIGGTSDTLFQFTTSDPAPPGQSPQGYYRLQYWTSSPGPGSVSTWYSLRYKNVVNAIAFSSAGSIDMSGSHPGGGQCWVPNGMYIGQVQQKLNAMNRVSGPTFRGFTFAGGATPLHGNFVAWGASAPSGGVTEWYPGDLVIDTGVAPAAWICRTTGIPSPGSFGEIWASQNGSFVVGSPAHPVSALVLGNGPSHGAPPAVTYAGTDATGDHVAGADMTMRPGRGTGTGTGGAFNVEVAPAGSVVGALNGVIRRLRVPGDGPIQVKTHRSAGEEKNIESFGSELVGGVDVTAWSRLVNPNEALHVRACVVLRATGEAASLEIATTVYRNQTGVTSPVGPTTVIHAQRVDASWNASFDVDAATSMVRLRLRGDAANATRAVGWVEYSIASRQ